MRITKVYYARLETIPGRFANETFGCEVEVLVSQDPKEAFEKAQKHVSEMHRDSNTNSHEVFALKEQVADLQRQLKEANKIGNLRANLETEVARLSEERNEITKYLEAIRDKVEEIPF